MPTTDVTAGAVAIGRNEGERLTRCLNSLSRHFENVVYVDSGSTDDSVNSARRMNASVVILDCEIPFTAGRARNAGIERLREIAPQTEFVQFVDGDCEIDNAWPETAITALVERSELAAVCGRRRERNPDESVFNRLIDLEWDTPVGDVDSCGASRNIPCNRVLNKAEPCHIGFLFLLS